MQWIKGKINTHNVKRIEYDSLVLIYENIPHVNSISFGLWIPVGSRDESLEENGYTHFLEHNLFKGTKNRTKRDIALEVDRVGGVLNAATNREYTYYYISIMSDYLDLGFDLLSDMFYNSIFPEEEIEREKQVVIEEIKMYEDTPDEWIHDIFMEKFYPDSSLGRPILGTVDNVLGITRDKLVSFYKKNYMENKVVISIAGKLDESLLLRNVDKYFAPHLSENGKRAFNKHYALPRNSSGEFVVEKQLSQVHAIVGFPAIEKTSPYRYAIYVLSTILGGNMSSRLFQRLREEEALCYSVYSFHSLFRDTGVFGIYLGASEDNVYRALSIVKEEIYDILENGVKEQEFLDAKSYLKGNFSLSLEHTESRMVYLARNELAFSKIYSVEEVFRKLDEITLDDIRELSMLIFSNKPFIVGIGNIDPSSIGKSWDQ